VPSDRDLRELDLAGISKRRAHRMLALTDDARAHTAIERRLDLLLTRTAS